MPHLSLACRFNRYISLCNPALRKTKTSTFEKDDPQLVETLSSILIKKQIESFIYDKATNSLNSFIKLWEGCGDFRRLNMDD